MSSIIKSNRVSQETTIDLRKDTVHMMGAETEVVESVALQQQIAAEAHYRQAAAEAEAKKIIEEARFEGQKCLSEATLEIENRYKKLNEEIEERKREMDKQASQIYLDAQNQANDLIQEAYGEKEKILQEAEPEVIALVKQLISHIIHEELVSHTEWLHLLVKKIRLEEQIKESFEVYVNQDTYNRLTSEEKVKIENIGEGVMIKVDEALTSSACKIHTNHGSIVYDVDEGLEKVIKEIEILERL